MDEAMMNAKEQELLDALAELKETARIQGNMVSEEQLQEILTALQLRDDQKDLITEYLKQNHIGIGEPLSDEEALDEEDFHYLNAYMEELKALPPVTDGEKRAITMSAMAGDADAKARLMEIYLPDVVEIAKLYTGQGVELADLIGEGNVAVAMGMEMMGALEQPEEVEGALGKIIMDAMEELIEEETGERRKDDKILKLVNRVDRASEELAADLGRKVTVEELAAESGISVESIRKAIRISAKHMEYIEWADNADIQ